MATTRKPRTAKTSEQLKQELEATEKKLAELRKRAYAEELREAINATSIAADYAMVKAKVKDAGELVILQAIADAIGIKRLTIAQAPPAKRNTKPKVEKSTAKNSKQG